MSFLIYHDQISDGNIDGSILIFLHDQTKLEQVHLTDTYCVTVRPCKRDSAQVAQIIIIR